MRTNGSWFRSVTSPPFLLRDKHCKRLDKQFPDPVASISVCRVLLSHRQNLLYHTRMIACESENI